MLQGIRAYPAAWYASLAIGAMYRKLELRSLGYRNSNRNSFPQLQYYENAALIYCSKAARLLVEMDHEETSPSQREMLLISCILLICYAGLRRDTAQTVTHMYNGVYLSKKWDYWQLKPGRDRSYRLPNCVVPVSSVGQLFRRLEMQLISSPLTLPDFLTLPIQPVHIAVDVPYHSAAEAYAELLPIANAHRYLFYQANRSDVNGLRILAAEGAAIRDNFLLWSDKFNAYKDSFSKRKSDPEEADRITAVTLWEMGGRIMSFADISKGTKIFDGYQDEICRSLPILEYFLDGSQLGKTYTSASWLPSLSSFMSLMGQPLRFLATVCRVPTIRRRCLQLLIKYPFIDGTLDSTYVAVLAQTKMELEEDGWYRAPIPGGCECVPDVSVCAEHRIPTPAIEPHKDGRRVTLKNAYEIANGLPGSTITMPWRSKGLSCQI